MKRAGDLDVNMGLTPPETVTEESPIMSEELYIPEKQKKKAEKIAAKRAKKSEKTAKKRGRIQRQVEKKISKLGVKYDKILAEISTETNPAKLKKLEKKRDKISKKTDKVTLSGISKAQRSAMDVLNVKIKGFKVWVILLIVLILIVITVSAIWLVEKYSDENYYSGEYYWWRTRADVLQSDLVARNEEIDDLKEEIQKLQTEKSNLEDEVEQLETENSKLETKAEWFDSGSKIVIADTGSLYKTYHTYDCTRWRGCSYWIYNKEQVINNSNYKKCPYCN